MEVIKAPAILLLLALFFTATYCDQYDYMRCSYGERGSLTATCVNATPSFFKSSNYRFDELDETLVCLNCSLNTLDTGVFDLSGNKIKHLDIRNSKVEKINSRAFLGLIFMEYLDISHNNIHGIYPTAFEGVKKIRIVDLSYNSITFLNDDGFLELIQLGTLNLQHNFIKGISPKSFNGLESLKVLDLSYNNLEEILEGTLAPLNHSLQILNLEHNIIRTLNGTEFFNLTALVELNLSNNKLTNPVIHMAHISEIPLMDLAPQSLLRSLYLASNHIDMLQPGFLKGLGNLEVLDLGDNYIQEIQMKTFQDLFNLHNLNLTGNKLVRIDTGMFTGLPQLRELNCSNNEIVEVRISGAFSIPNLHALDLSYNKLSDLDYSALIARLPKLAYLKLVGDQFSCYLMQEMTEYFMNDNFKFVRGPSCIDAPQSGRRPLPVISDKVATVAESGITSAEIWIFCLLAIVFVLVGVLFLLQYRTLKDLSSKSAVRTTSSFHLISSDLEGRD